MARSPRKCDRAGCPPLRNLTIKLSQTAFDAMQLRKIGMAHIVVVEDDDNIRMLIHDLLVLEGHTVHVAPDGKAALRDQALANADLVVTDIFMPEHDGFELIMQMRELFPDIRIIAISGDQLGPQFGSLRIAQQLGAHAVLQKPFRPEEFIELINQTLSAE